MDYIKIRFGNEMDGLTADFHRTLEGVFRPRPASPMFADCDYSWHPQMDIYETDREIVVRAEIAGVDKADLEVEINRKALRIHGKRAELKCSQGGVYRLAEIPYGKFERIVYLPTPVDTDTVTSSYINGFLELRLTKLPTDVTYKIPIADD